MIVIAHFNLLSISVSYYVCFKSKKHFIKC